MATTQVDVGGAVEFYVGEDRVITWVVKDAAGVPLDCTGREFLWQLRISKYHPTVVLEKSTAPGGGIAVDPDQIANKGKVHVTFDSDDTAAHGVPPAPLYPGTYSYGLAQTNAVFDVEASGDFVLLQSAVMPA